MCKSNFQIIQTVTNTGVLSEREILNIIHRANRGGGKSYELVWDAIEAATGCSLTDEHTQKGWVWLQNFIYCKNGRERKTNTLPAWCVEIFDNFKQFYFAGVQNIASFGSYYVPVWGVESTNGKKFEYYLNGGSVYIYA